jgi:hypothetical protein
VAIAGDKLIAEKVSMSNPAELYIVDPVTGKMKNSQQSTKEFLTS